MQHLCAGVEEDEVPLRSGFVEANSGKVCYHISVNNLKAVHLLAQEINKNRIVVRSPVVRSTIGVDRHDRLFHLLGNAVGVHNLEVSPARFYELHSVEEERFSCM